MLGIVREAMCQVGVLDCASNMECNVTVSTGDSITMEVCAAGTRWYYVKMSRKRDLGVQYANYRKAFSRFPHLAPAVSGWVNIGGWSILICPAIDHTTLRQRDLSDLSPTNPVMHDLLGFFATTKQLALLQENEATHEGLRSRLHEYYSHPGSFSGQILRFLDQTREDSWSEIPVSPQHGDFVLNNLGRVREHLVIFDWEDYGAIGLTGLDVLVLMLSVNGFSTSTLQAIGSGKHVWLSRFSRLACAAAGLSHGRFCESMPLYLIVFHYLKRNYGSGIRHRVGEVLNRILS